MTCFDCKKDLKKTVPGEEEHCFHDYHSRTVDRDGEKVDICMDCPTGGNCYIGAIKKRNIDGTPFKSVLLEKDELKAIRFKNQSAFINFVENISNDLFMEMMDRFDPRTKEEYELHSCGSSVIHDVIDSAVSREYKGDLEEILNSFGIQKAFDAYMSEFGEPLKEGDDIVSQLVYWAVYENTLDTWNDYVEWACSGEYMYMCKCEKIFSGDEVNICESCHEVLCSDCSKNEPAYKDDHCYDCRQEIEEREAEEEALKRQVEIDKQLEE